MKGFICLIYIIIVVNAVPKSYTNKKALLEDQKLHCDSICTTSDGVFDFNEKSKTCICYVGMFFDDVDLTLMRKNAKAMGMNLKTIKTSPKILSKRDTADDPEYSDTESTKKKSFFKGMKPGALFNKPKEKEITKSKFHLPQGKFSEQKKEDHSNQEGTNSDAIVGARANSAGIRVNSRAKSRPPPALQPHSNPLHPQSNPLQLGAMKDVWLKSRQRLDNLIKHSDGGKFNSRFAQSETQSIRNALKSLTLKSKPGQSGPKHMAKPLSVPGKSSGLIRGSKSGGGFSKHPQGLKTAGSPLKLAPANHKPFQINNKPNLNALSRGSLINKASKPRILGLSRQSVHTESRMNLDNDVGASKQIEAAEVGSNHLINTPNKVNGLRISTTATVRGVSPQGARGGEKKTADFEIHGEKDKRINKGSDSSHKKSAQELDTVNESDEESV